MLVSLSFGLCMSRATARVMTVSIFDSARKDSLEGCEEDSLRWVVVLATLYSCDKVLYIFLGAEVSIRLERSKKNARSLQFESSDCAG